MWYVLLWLHQTWLEYFDSKAIEQNEVVQNDAPKLNDVIANKGHHKFNVLLFQT